jgi:hypothetical protein
VTDEEYVLAHWADAHELEGLYGTCLVWVDKHHMFSDWSNAAKFTRDRLEQIRQLKEEIGEAEFMRRHFTGDIGLLRRLLERIVARLESALAELAQGMTEPKP